MRSHFFYETVEYTSECSCDRDSCDGCETYEAHKADAHDKENEDEQK